MLEARVGELTREAERVYAERTSLGVSTYCDEVHGARARADEMLRVAEEVGSLQDGDVSAARVLRFELASRSAAQAKLHNFESWRSRASAEGGVAVRRYLLPQCITWVGPHVCATEGELEILARVMAGVRDVRVRTVEIAASDLPIVPPVTREHWRAMLTADDAQRERSGERLGGVVLFCPDEVADLRETEAQLYDEAADRLCRSRSREAEGGALRYLAKDLRGEVWRVRALAPGDVSGARRLLASIYRERRDRDRAQRRALWRRAVDHLEVIAELVEDLLLPLEMDGPAYREHRGSGNELEVYRRWEAGMLDVRDSVAVPAGVPRGSV